VSSCAGWLQAKRSRSRTAGGQLRCSRPCRRPGRWSVSGGGETLARLELIRVSDRILAAAGALPPPELRALDAIHLATAKALGSDLARLVTYDGAPRLRGGGNGVLRSARLTDARFPADP
jgi:uncharacterized protein